MLLIEIIYMYVYAYMDMNIICILCVRTTLVYIYYL